MLDIHKELISLAQIRPLFHAENDFQHALAWLIQKNNPSWQCRLEVPLRMGKFKAEVDILFRSEERTIAIELKYKVKRANLNYLSEEFFLTDQSAQDHGRYDFVRDISRIERLISAGIVDGGYAIFLTNQSLYWRDTNRALSVDNEFKIHEGKKLAGTLVWSPLAGKGTTKNREESIPLMGTYDLSWKDFSFIPNYKNSHFRYLVVSIVQ